MDRVIEMQVAGYQIRRGSEALGAMGTGNAVLLRFRFDAAWDGLSKRAKFTDARGEGGVTTEVELLTRGADGSYTVPVPREAMAYEGMAELSLVGELAENGYVTKRLTTKPLSLRIYASGADREAQNTEPITATDKQQILAKVDAAEAYAVGTADGVPVAEREKDNAKYYKEQADAARKYAEALADGTVDGEPVPQFAENNAKHYKDQAEIAKKEAEDAQGSAESAMENAILARKEAESYCDTALGAKTAAEIAKTAAEEAKSEAVTAMVSAISAKDAAKAAAVSAETAAGEATSAAEGAAKLQINSMLDVVVAAEYDSDADYSTGDLVTYEGSLLRFKVDHIGIGEDPDPTEFDEVTIAGELKSEKSFIGNLVTNEKKGVEIVVDDISPYGSAVLTSYITLVQDGTGDPSPDNVRPISGHNEVKLTHRATNHEAKTVAVTPGKTIYGGTMDWNTGKLVNEVAYFTFTGEENWQEVGAYNSRYVFLTIGQYGYANQQKKTTCSHFMPAAINSSNILIGVNVVNSAGYGDCRVLFRPNLNFTLAEWIAFLKEQHAKGTPVQVCFYVNEPQTITFAPQKIDVFVGETNTYSGNAGDTKIVYGREVMSAMKELQNAIVSLGGII